MRIRQLYLTDSTLWFVNEAKDPPYSLYFSSLNVQTNNLSNHFSQGPARIEVTGIFMGSGRASIRGSFRPDQFGPDLTMDITLEKISLRALNGLWRAYGRFDVQAGTVSVYSQLAAKQGTMNGYVKLLFSNIEVYDSRKDSGKAILHQAYELAIGGVAHVLKNHSSHRVATEIPISGQLCNPNTDTGNAVLELLENAFIQAILPGFDHAEQTNG